MAILTPELLSGSIVVMLVFYFIAFGFQIFMMFLNWKQSRVNNQMKELLEEVKAMHTLMKSQKTKKTKNNKK